MEEDHYRRSVLRGLLIAATAALSFTVVSAYYLPAALSRGALERALKETPHAAQSQNAVDPAYLTRRDEFWRLFNQQRKTGRLAFFGDPTSYIAEEPNRSWHLYSFGPDNVTAHFSPILTKYDPSALAGAFIVMSDGIKIKAERERTVVWTQRPDGLETIAKDLDMSEQQAKDHVNDVLAVMKDVLDRK